MMVFIFIFLFSCHWFDIKVLERGYVHKLMTEFIDIYIYIWWMSSTANHSDSKSWIRLKEGLESRSLAFCSHV